MANATVEVWVLVDDNGDCVASHDEEQLVELYESCVQSVSHANGLRRVKVILTVPLPEIVRGTGTVPQEGTATLEVK